MIQRSTAPGDDGRWSCPRHAAGPSMDDPAAQGAWLAIQRERFDELHRQLVDQGWRPVGHGTHWWSVIYKRGAIDPDIPPEPATPADDPGSTPDRSARAVGCLAEPAHHLVVDVTDILDLQVVHPLPRSGMRHLLEAGRPIVPAQSD